MGGIRRLVPVLVLVALVLGGGCRVETTVGVDVGHDGSGKVVVEVVLDEAAVRRVGDVKEEIRTSDLRAAGWTVDEPHAVEGGGQRLQATRPFADLEEAERIFRSLATDGAPFGTVSIDQRRGFWSTETSFDATVDLAGGLESLGDPELSAALGGQPLGMPTEELERRLGAALDRMFQLRVAVRLPGDVESNAPQELDGGARWTPELGATVSLEASSTDLNRSRILFAVIAATTALAAAGLAGGRAMTRRRHHLPASLRPEGPEEDRPPGD